MAAGKSTKGGKVQSKPNELRTQWAEDASNDFSVWTVFSRLVVGQDQRPKWQLCKRQYFLIKSWIEWNGDKRTKRGKRWQIKNAWQTRIARIGKPEINPENSQQNGLIVHKKFI